jgi:hypothetical protein
MNETFQKATTDSLNRSPLKEGEMSEGQRGIKKLNNIFKTFKNNQQC